MTDTAIRYADPQLATRDSLRSLLAQRQEAEALGVTVSTRAPKRDDGSPALPHVQVRTVGKSRDYRLNGQASVRLTVWHRDEGLAERLASLAEALLLSSSSAAVRSYGPSAGPLPGEDEETDEPITTFTLTARLRPANL